MGYYTSYSLEVINDTYGCDHKEGIVNSSKFGDPFTESCTWYKHENEMRSYSKRHPETIFKLIGEGSDNGDLWIKYFKDGKMQECRAVITYPEMDLSKFE